MGPQTRREFLGTVAAAGAAALSRGMPAQDAPKRSPNLVLIMADDCSAREFGCYGHQVHRTPNIDRLADTGVMFRTCWATPICSPSRAEIMTGRYAFRTGWFHNNLKTAPPDPGYDLAKSHILFSELLQEAGYATAMAGKWQLSGKYPTLIYEYGFDEYCMWPGMERGLPKGHQYDGPVEGPEATLPGRAARYWHPAAVKNGEWLPTKPHDYGPDIYTDFLIDFMTRHRDGPFLAYYPMCLTHKSWDFDLKKNTYVPTPELDENGNKTGRKTADTLQSNVEYTDHLVGRIVQALDELGIRDNTIIMFTGDNGTAGFGKNQLHEGGPLVPMVCNCPGIVKPTGPSDALVDFSDVLPTLADFAGARLPDGYAIDGRSFAPILRREKTETREWVFSPLADARLLRDRRWFLSGDGRFYDCGDNRTGVGYTDVTDSQNPEVVAARQRFEQILEGLPAPTQEQRERCNDPDFSILKRRKKGGKTQ
jgi:arylsulfatase A